MSGLTQAARLHQLAVTINQRDRAMLSEIGRLRLVTGGQLARVFFPSSPSPVSGGRACRKQLQRLCDLGLIESMPRPVGGVRGGSAGTIWRSTSEGRRLTAWLGGEELPGRRSRYLAGAAHQAHTLDLSELYVRLREADQAGQIELLEHQAEPACWRSFVAGYGGLGQLKPDAFVRLGVGDWEQLAFVELDRGTEGSSALQRKADTYLAYWRSGHEQQEAGVFPRVVWLAATERRQEQLRRHLVLDAGTAGPTVVIAAVDDAVAVLSGEPVVMALARSPQPALYGDRTRWALLHGDSLAMLPLLPDHSVDLVLTDPPYAIGIAGQAWDGRYLVEPEGFQAFTTAWAREARRVLRPGGYLAAFGSPRTVHRLVAGIEDAGLEIRDQLLWLYGSGPPKSRRLESGLGTTLRPAYEPIVVARAPLEPGLTITDNLERHGTGAMDIEGAAAPRPAGERPPGHDVGFWPANLALSHESGCHPERGCRAGCVVPLIDRHADASGRRPGAPRLSRLFYAAKASRTERESGLTGMPSTVSEIFSSGGRARPRANHHPTVKPVLLCRWLVRLLAPPGAVVLDPFAGSGSLGIGSLLEGRQFVGIERESDYIEIARARLTHWSAVACNELTEDPDRLAP